MKNGHDFGSHVIALGVLMWMSVSVGPWYVGVILFMLGWIFNMAWREVWK